MTRAEQDHLEELLRRIERRHCHQNTGTDRLLREAATWQDVEEALAMLRDDRERSAAA